MGSKGEWFRKNFKSEKVKILSCLGEGRMILDRKSIFRKKMLVKGNDFKKREFLGLRLATIKEGRKQMRFSQFFERSSIRKEKVIPRILIDEHCCSGNDGVSNGFKSKGDYRRKNFIACAKKAIGLQ